MPSARHSGEYRAQISGTPRRPPSPPRRPRRPACSFRGSSRPRALARGGIAAVAVDPLATELGISRGSFYWHFADRAALLTAALELWEHKATTEVIDALTAVPDPRDRLAALFTEAFGDEGVAGLEPALLAHADHPAVAAVFAPVTSRRIEFLTRLYTELYTNLGLTADAARHQAVLAYATYLGRLELRRAAPDIVPEAAGGAPAEAALAHLIAQLTPAQPPPG